MPCSPALSQDFTWIAVPLKVSELTDPLFSLDVLGEWNGAWGGKNKSTLRGRRDDRLSSRGPNGICSQVSSCTASEIILAILAFAASNPRKATKSMAKKKKKTKNALKRWQCVSLEGKPRHVVGVKEMQNYKKNPSHGCLKMMFLAALGITVVQAEKYLIKSLALSLRCGCLGNLHAQYSLKIKPNPE